MSEYVRTDGRTTFVATPEGEAAPLPAGETVLVEDARSCAPVVPAWSAVRQEPSGVYAPTAIPGEAATGLTVSPVGANPHTSSESFSVIDARIVLDMQRLLTLALDHVPPREANLRAAIVDALHVRVDA